MSRASTWLDRRMEHYAGVGVSARHFEQLVAKLGRDVVLFREFYAVPSVGFKFLCFSLSVDTMARLREQDDKFCQTLRAAIERGREFCPTVVSTAPGTQQPMLGYTRPE